MSATGVVSATAVVSSADDVSAAIAASVTPASRLASWPAPPVPPLLGTTQLACCFGLPAGSPAAGCSAQTLAPPQAVMVCHSPSAPQATIVMSTPT